jgi:hypothetical protein
VGSSGWEIMAEDKNQLGAQDGRLWPRIRTSEDLGMGDYGRG